MQVRLVSMTKVDPSFLESLAQEPDTTPEYLRMLESPEALVIHCARVSSPTQKNPSYVNLLKYCMQQEHWSILEMVDVTFEIVTSRGLSPQFLRHRSFCFQEYSLRYSAAQTSEGYKARRQDAKNRQNSINDLTAPIQLQFQEAQEQVWQFCYQRYQEALEQGIAKECARFLLPLSTQTRFYMKGPLRSWVHYLAVRDKEGTQLEHRQIAQEIKKTLNIHFPNVIAALE